MRRIIYMAVMVTAMLFSFIGSNDVQAQNMATESYNPWHGADDTGSFFMQRCDSCDVLITGKTQNELEINMSWHMADKHPYNSTSNLYTGSGDGYSGDNGETSGNGGNNKINTYVVGINIVAYSLERIGVCNAEWFVDEYNSFVGGYVMNNYARLEDVDWFIRWKFKSMLCNVSVFCPFMGFVKPAKGYCYEVVTKENIGSNCDIDYRYWYVFNIW